MAYTLTDVSYADVSYADVNLLEHCASHYKVCWQESYRDRLPEIAMEELLEQSSASEIKSWLTGDGNRVLTVVTSEDSIVGSVACNCISDKCYVWGMYVLQKHQGVGVGGMLLERIVEKARRCGAVVLEVTVLDSSAAAVGFYQSHGFVEIDKSVYEITSGIELASKTMELKI